MAPVETSTNLMQGYHNVSHSTRARELYKYYQPSVANDISNTLITPDNSAPISEDPASFDDIHIDSTVSSGKISSPDTALTAFAQLVSWRTGCQRSMISVIDVATQYFIAESTRTLDLVDNTVHGPDDSLWMGCSQVTKAGRLCERTIELPPAPFGEYQAFIVNDLSKDPRFNTLPFVSGPPFLKFYAGTPLITKRGIPIGSLFVVDDRVRDGMGRDDIHFMGTMAATVMRHLEMAREVEEHRRGMKMSRGLASFVEGRSQLVEADAEIEDEGQSVVGDFKSDVAPTSARSKNGSTRGTKAVSKKGSNNSIRRKEREYAEDLMKREETIMSANLQPHTQSPALEEGISEPQQAVTSSQSQQSYHTFNSSNTNSPLTIDKSNTPGSPDESEASTMKLLFSRAANLIREAFEVDGGSVFLDAQKGVGKGFDNERKLNPDGQPSSSGEDAFATDAREVRRPTRIGSFSGVSGDSRAEVEILGFSTPQAASINGESPPGDERFSTFDERSLHTLLRRYPRGKLWTFDEDGPVSSSSEDDDIIYKSRTTERQETLLRRKRRRARLAAEARTLVQHFPGVRQLLFVPLWDSSRSRWLAGNFTWTTEPTRILTKQGELAFLTGFGNSVMAECSRLDTEIADQKKSDFIGSISHELRSPLHGILASAEFLGEEVTEAFSKGLVETIDSCGRTLLDTINHILDFSKINHFEKNWRRSRRRGSVSHRQNPLSISKSSGPLALRQADLPMINLFADVDIAIVSEEVVESVYAGHVFQHVTAPSFDRVPASRGTMADSKKHLTTDDTLAGAQPPDVALILDVDMQNYHFITQPGAFRRVVMNLLGNALKYTSHGHVRVKLEATEMDDFKPPGTTESIPRSCVTVTVSDTGKGISAEFLRSKLFTPFAQENSLSSGTGLGLSIVRSIVILLEGNISIKSELGRGTEVKITLPLLRELPVDQSSSGSGASRSATSSSPRDHAKELEGVIEQLRSRVIGRTVALHGFDVATIDPHVSKSNQLLKDSVTNFLSNWYGLKLKSAGENVDIIIVNEPDIDTARKLSEAPTGSVHGPLVLALCSHSTRYDRAHGRTDDGSKIGFLAKPIGPLKLARALVSGLDGHHVASTPGAPPSLLNANGSTSESSDLSNVFEELTLSSNGGEVLDNSRMAAGSANARKALQSPNLVGGMDKSEFPFPVDDRPQILKSKSMPVDKESLATIATPTLPLPLLALPRASAVLTNMEKTANEKPNEKSSSSKPTSTLPAPRLLLVDDNKINLRLLRTFMRKRQYTEIDEAENGLEAVNAFEKRTDGYDIVFMDISMPVLDGFGATRLIRKQEHKRREKKLAKGEIPDNPALVIALTGLASSRDQSEAFTSGVDLFMTKPVSFKEVGKMLDNWAANREREAKHILSSTGEPLVAPLPADHKLRV